jgi:folylpolyglutamate synthase/dihydropteroate synthase
MALKKDKDADTILPEILRVADQIIVTQFIKETDMGNMLCKDPEELATILKTLDSSKEISIDRDPIHAVKAAVAHQEEGTAILVTGSLYLVGEIKKALIEKKIIL